MIDLRRIIISLFLAIALSGPMAVLTLPEPASAQLGLGNQPINSGQCKDSEGRLDPKNVAGCIDPDIQDFPWILTTWRWSLSIVNVFAVIVLIIMAFANIIYPWKFLEPYRIRQLLPQFIWGIILANLSILICRAVVSLADLLLASDGLQVTLTQLYDAWGINPAKLPEGVIQAKFPNGGLAGGGTGGEILNDVGKLVFELIVSTLLVYLPIIALLALAFIFYARFAVIFFFTAISPLAFGAVMFPATQKYLTQWWDMFWKWTFGGVASYLLLFLASKVADNGSGNTNANYIDIIPYIIGLILVYMAIQAPFKMGGAIAAGYVKATRWAGKHGWSVGKWAGGKAWKSYGSLGAWAYDRMNEGAADWRKEWDESKPENGGRRMNKLKFAKGLLKAGVAGAIARTNLYGISEAGGKGEQLREDARMYAARAGSSLYHRSAGEQATAVFFEDKYRDIYNKQPYERIKQLARELDPQDRWNDLSAEEKSKFLYSKPKAMVEMGKKMGLKTPEDFAKMRLFQQRIAVEEERARRDRRIFRGEGDDGGEAGGGGAHGVPVAAGAAAPTRTATPQAGLFGGRAQRGPQPPPTTPPPTSGPTPPPAPSGPGSAPGGGSPLRPNPGIGSGPAAGGKLAPGGGSAPKGTPQSKNAAQPNPTQFAPGAAGGVAPTSIGLGAQASVAATAAAAAKGGQPRAGGAVAPVGAPPRPVNSLFGAPAPVQPASGPAPSAIGVAEAPKQTAQLLRPTGPTSAQTIIARSKGAAPAPGKPPTITTGSAFLAAPSTPAPTTSPTTTSSSSASADVVQQAKVGQVIPGKIQAAPSSGQPKSATQIISSQATPPPVTVQREVTQQVVTQGPAMLEQLKVNQQQVVTPGQTTVSAVAGTTTVKPGGIPSQTSIPAITVSAPKAAAPAPPTPPKVTVAPSAPSGSPPILQQVQVEGPATSQPQTVVQEVQVAQQQAQQAVIEQRVAPKPAPEVQAKQQVVEMQQKNATVVGATAQSRSGSPMELEWNKADNIVSRNNIGGTYKNRVYMNDSKGEEQFRKDLEAIRKESFRKRDELQRHQNEMLKALRSAQERQDQSDIRFFNDAYQEAGAKMRMIEDDINSDADIARFDRQMEKQWGNNSEERLEREANAAYDNLLKSKYGQPVDPDA